jgi:hypothetical protein
MGVCQLKRCGAPKRRPGDRRENADASAGRESQLLGDVLPQGSIIVE